MHNEQSRTKVIIAAKTGSVNLELSFCKAGRIAAIKNERNVNMKSWMCVRYLIVHLEK